MALFDFKTNEQGVKTEFSIMELTPSQMNILAVALKDLSEKMNQTGSFDKLNQDQFRMVKSLFDATMAMLYSRPPKPAPSLKSDLGQDMKSWLLNNISLKEELCRFLNRDIDSVDSYIVNNDPVLSHIDCIAIIAKSLPGGKFEKRSRGGSLVLSELKLYN